MTTAIDLIKRARRLAGIARIGETPSGDLAQAGLEALISMLDSWRIKKLFVYQVREETFTWTAGQQSRTVGAAGNFVTDQPSHIDPATVFQLNNIDYPITLLDAAGWAAISSKQNTSDIPEYLYPQQGASLMTLYAYPIPSGSISLILKSWKLLQTFSLTTDTVTLPPGYQLAIETSLAEFLCIEASRPITAELARAARSARDAIKTINVTIPRMSVEFGYKPHENIVSE